MKQRLVGVIALILENERGGYYSMYLATREWIHAFIGREIPINYQVISKVKDFVNLTLSANHPVHPCAPAKGRAHAYT